MNVKIEIRFTQPSTAIEKQQAYELAKSFTNNPKSILVTLPTKKSKIIVTEFSVDKARQIEIVDIIGREFGYLFNYDDLTISFPS